VSRRQFQALDCVSVAGGSYLRVDTSIDCASARFRTFRVVDGLLIAAYLSIVLLWLVLLCKNRARMNPWLSDQARSLYLRDRDEKLGSYRLLFQPYRIHCYHFECIEMLKRMLFVSALPLVSPMPSRRAACGVALALFFAPMYREVQPFVRDATNKLAILASYAVLLTYCMAGRWSLRPTWTRN